MQTLAGTEDFWTQLSIKKLLGQTDSQELVVLWIGTCHCAWKATGTIHATLRKLLVQNTDYNHSNFSL